MDKILIVDDEHSIRDSFEFILKGKYNVLIAASGEAALKLAADNKIDLVYLDIRMPGLDGLETLQKLKQLDAGQEIVMVTAVNEVRKASQAIKMGARDYLVKPFDVDSILKMTQAILLRRKLIRDGSATLADAHKTTPRLVGQSEAIIQIEKLIERISSSNLRVLITGERGTEKEAVAQIIHLKSGRADHPFISFDLSPEYPSSYIESRLIGQAKGATVADLGKVSGLLEEARDGTLLINHVEYMPSISQPLHSSGVRILGWSSSEELPSKNKAAYDFFSEVLISLPPLRQRISDLPLLINYLVEKFNLKYGLEIKGFDSEAEEALSNYDWPGNVSELEIVTERSMLLCQSERITADELPIDILLKSSGSRGGSYLARFEKSYLSRIMEMTGNDRERAAAVLKLNPVFLEGKV